MYHSFDQMSPRSRVWVYVAPRPLSPEDQATVLSQGKSFVEEWTAHSRQLLASVAVLHDQAVVLALDESQAPATGCSIDKSVDLFRQLGAELGIDFFDRQVVVVQRGGEQQTWRLPEAKAALAKGDLDGADLYLNPMVQTLADLQAGWPQPLSQSWLAKYLPRVAQ